LTTIRSSTEINPILEEEDMNSSIKKSVFSEMYDYLDVYESKDDEKLISIIIPLFNEEKTIRNIIERLPRHNKIEVIVVDDCSTDNSVNEIRKVKHYREIKIIKHLKNKGYGGALATGINTGVGKVIVTLDSDGQHCPEDIFTLIKPILNRTVDYTIGSRYLGQFFYKLPVSTRLGEALIEKCINIFFGVKVANNQNGFRAFHRKMIHIFDDIKYQGYALATELILKAAIYGYTIKEVPIRLYDRPHGTSKIKISRLTMNLFSCLLRYYVRKIRLHLFSKQYIQEKFLKMSYGSANKK